MPMGPLCSGLAELSPHTRLPCTSSPVAPARPASAYVPAPEHRHAAAVSLRLWPLAPARPAWNPLLLAQPQSSARLCHARAWFRSGPPACAAPASAHLRAACLGFAQSRAPAAWATRPRAAGLPRRTRRLRVLPPSAPRATRQRSAACTWPSRTRPSRSPPARRSPAHAPPKPANPRVHLPRVLDLPLGPLAPGFPSARDWRRGSTGRRTEEERGRKKRFDAVATGGKEDKAPGIREQRRRGKKISQGLMRDFKKLQGLVCKAKFPVDLKP
jgi:hypothetical protein